jgi:GT2 family glycosyltransferase
MNPEINYKISIIILNWNGFEVTKDCLLSLLSIYYKNVNIIVVDNASKDDSVIKLQDIKLLKDIEFISLKRNLGFTGGNNVGIDYAKLNYNPDFYLLLNNDTIVQPNFIEEMLKGFVEYENCYAVVPKIFYFDNPKKIWFCGGKVSRITGRVTHYGQHKEDSLTFSQKGPTGFMNGCCAMISKESIEKLGVLDDRFFANSEDADYSLRILDSGHSIVLMPTAIIFHKVSYSFESNKGKWLTFYLASRGIVILQLKHLSGIMLPVFWIAFSIRWILYLTFKLALLRDFKSLKGLYFGVQDGILKRLRFLN